MTDFVIVVASLASLTLAAPAPHGIAAPSRQPTVGFSTYRSADACEAATEALTPPPGTRLVCVPVEQPEHNATN